MRAAWVLVLMLAGVAAAEEGVSKRDYPASLVERPMILPRLGFQLTVEGDLTNFGFTGPNAGSGQGGVLAFGADVGILHNLQAGAFVTFAVAPLAAIGDVVGNLQVNLVPRVLNLRADVGAEQLSLGAVQAQQGSLAFYFGLGLPLRAKLHRVFAITSGSTSARGLGAQPLLPASALNRAGAYGGTVFTNDVLTLVAVNLGGTQGGTVVGAFHLPVGFLVQPIPELSFGVRTGYRVVFTNLPGTGVTHWVPIGFDLVGTLARVIDLGFTAQIYGFVGQSGRGSSGATYEQRQQYSFWVAGRI